MSITSTGTDISSTPLSALASLLSQTKRDSDTSTADASSLTNFLQSCSSTVQSASPLGNLVNASA